MTELVRKNIRMSPEIAKYYEDKARELGISQSAMMVIALNEYIKQEKTINMMSNMEYMLKLTEAKPDPEEK